MTIRQEYENSRRSRMKLRPRRCRHEEETEIGGSYGREIDDKIKEEENGKEIKKQRTFLSCYLHTTTILKNLHVKSSLGSERVTAHYIEQAK